MGALTSNRKRGNDYLTSNLKYTSSDFANFDDGIDSHIPKKPKTSSSPMRRSPVLLKNSASRVYPEPLCRIRREVHAPCRVTKIRFQRSLNQEPRRSVAGFVRKEGLGGQMGNFLTVQYFKKDKEVIDVDAEADKDEVLEDSGIEEVEVVEDGRELEGKVRPSSSSVDSELTNGNLKLDKSGRMLESLSLSREVDVLGLPVHKKLLESAEKRSPKLKSLSFQIKFNEMRRAFLQLRRHLKLEEDVRQDVFNDPFVPLTEEEEAEVSQAFSKSNRKKILVTHENSNIEITGELLLCLRPGAWLNDEVINIYLELLKEREKREPTKFLKCHFFNTFFYEKLIGGRNGYDFKSVRRWTTQRKLGYCLVDCDKIFVPIHKEIHWCLAVINKKDEKFQYLDSLRGIDTQVLKVLARYFVDEVKDKSGEEIDVSSWTQEYVEDLPVQKNGWDCGVFMIKYADFYSRGLGLCFNQISLTGEAMQATVKSSWRRRNICHISG